MYILFIKLSLQHLASQEVGVSSLSYLKGSVVKNTKDNNKIKHVLTFLCLPTHLSWLFKMGSYHNIGNLFYNRGSRLAYLFSRLSSESGFKVLSHVESKTLLGF